MNIIRTILVCGMMFLQIQAASAQTGQRPSGSPFPSGFDVRNLGAARPTVQPNKTRRIGLRLGTVHFATNFVVGEVEIGEDIPEQIAVVVKPPGLELEWATLKWVPYTPTVPIDLGPGDGQRMIWIACQWDGGRSQSGSGTQVEVQRTPPLIVITNPTERVTSWPMIPELRGYSARDLQSIRYDVINASNRLENKEGFVSDTVTDFSVAGHISTNYFFCLDIDLSVGTNTVILRCQDWAGNIATNTLTYILDLDHDKTPPVISLDSPSDGARIMGQTFTARGRLDDPTAKITGRISVAGLRTNVIGGVVERNGYFWVENIPLALGNNDLTLTVTDAAGNSASTNFSVVGVEGTLLMDAIPPDQLWWRAITVTGKVDPPNRSVWINRVQAKVKPDGSWIATNVPVLSPNGGTVCFDMRAIPAEERTTVASKSTGQISVQSVLETNAVTLNPSLPACGTFKLHLIGTAGRSFILLASTNLVDWGPILTNLSADAAFDFVDTNTAGYGCRFFRVIPYP